MKLAQKGTVMVITMAEPKRKFSEVKEDRSGRKSGPIQVEKDLARMAAVIAAHDNITQSELVSDHLRPFLITHYRRVQQAIREELKGSSQAAGE